LIDKNSFKKSTLLLFKAGFFFQEYPENKSMKLLIF